MSVIYHFRDIIRHQSMQFNSVLEVIQVILLKVAPVDIIIIYDFLSCYCNRSSILYRFRDIKL